jgi:DNA repair ATPase RecN
MLYEKEFSYSVHVVWHTLYTAPQTTLDVGVQDAAHQALIAFCQEVQDLDSQRLSEMEKKYVQQIEDLQAWERVQEQKIQVLQDPSFAQKGIIQSLRGSYGNLVKMSMMIKTTRHRMIMMWRTTSIPKKTSRV